MWSGLDARGDAGGHRHQRAALGTRRRSLRQQGARHPIARCVRADQGGDGVRHRAVATGRAARAARRVRRLRRTDDVDGGRVGAARARCRGRSASCRWGSGSARRSGRSSAACWRRSSGLRRSFLVTALFYVVALLMMAVFYKEPRVRHARAATRAACARCFASWRARPGSCSRSPSSSRCRPSIAASARSCRCSSSSLASEPTAIATVSGLLFSLDRRLRRARSPHRAGRSWRAGRRARS